MIKKQILLILCTIAFVNTAEAKRVYQEKVYKAQWCKARGGVMEYKLNDKTRVDCLLPTMAVEFDFANKWAECIGQALYYGQKTKRIPACVLIIEKGEKDLKYLRRLRYTVYNKKKIPEFRTYTIRPEQIIPVNYAK